MDWLRSLTETKYPYEALELNHIRLLRVTSTSKTLRCRLDQYPIDAAPEYHAISYSWGGDVVTKKILCNRKVLKVTKNLLEGLRSITRLFGSDSDLYLWVDAICIRQDDESEKSAQVQQMYQIFANAKSVYIWLGVAADDSDKFMQKLAECAKSFKQHEATKGHFAGNADDTLARLGLPPQKDEFWTALGKFISRPWFRRLWVLQEIVGDKQALFICGNYYCDFEVMHALYRRVYPIGVSRLMPRLPEGVSRHFSIVFNTRSSRKRSIALTFTNCGSRDCLEPLDRVYGLLGLMPARFRSGIKVDYSKETKEQYWKVWLDAFKLTVTSEKNLRFFDKLPSRIQLPQLPAWSPNLASWAEDTAPLTECRKPPRLVSVNKDDRRYIHITRKYSRLPKGHNLEPELSFPEEKTLRALGVNVDRVASVITYRPFMSWPRVYSRPKFDSSHKFYATLTWLRECYNVARDTAKSHDRAFDLESFARTLICLTESTEGDGLQGFECAPIYKVMYNCLTDPDNHIPEEFQVDEATLDWYVYQLACVQDYRVFFTTKEGRIGVASHRIQPGDTLTILFGGTVCYAIRKPGTTSNPKPEDEAEVKPETSEQQDNRKDNQILVAETNSTIPDDIKTREETPVDDQKLRADTTESSDQKGTSEEKANDNDNDNDKTEDDKNIKWQFICPAYVSGLMNNQVYDLLENGTLTREFFDLI